jgi:hypothetical protein
MRGTQAIDFVLRAVKSTVLAIASTLRAAHVHIQEKYGVRIEESKEM